jgi:hypothetical protein
MLLVRDNGSLIDGKKNGRVSVVTTTKPKNLDHKS